jgi:DNA ligase (NAD+)
MLTKKNKETLKHLLPYLSIEAPEAVAFDTPFSGKTVVFTGTLESLTRDEAKDHARRVLSYRRAKKAKEI